ncbi:hypothetical protein [Haloechinothrix sp. LS1_15]|uniref:hypothetical protein n=1 Tax=Haloechinothrix sp. LS1_15 TaxID=2652248 RepID=UPI00294B3FA9|nr:hypothetical protein [Haloechinothrix sp. LS1_15]
MSTGNSGRGASGRSAADQDDVAAAVALEEFVVEPLELPLLLEEPEEPDESEVPDDPDEPLLDPLVEPLLEVSDFSEDVADVELPDEPERESLR